MKEKHGHVEDSITVAPQFLILFQISVGICQQIKQSLRGGPPRIVGKSLQIDRLDDAPNVIVQLNSRFPQ
jgi:hypothetical protein